MIEAVPNPILGEGLLVVPRKGSNVQEVICASLPIVSNKNPNTKKIFLQFESKVVFTMITLLEGKII
jgi:hypothetical protein